MTNCEHIYCLKCLETIRKYSILKPNYNEKQITCPMCLRVSKLETGCLDQDLKYMGDIEIDIKDWQKQELDKSQLIQDDIEYDRSDICKNHLKLLETFCLDDKQFTCWMCHHFNYSDTHRGHKVVTLEEAYRKLRIEYKENLGLLLCLRQFVDQRLSYLNECRAKFKSDLDISVKQIDSYFTSLIKEIQQVQEEKKREVNQLFEKLDSEIRTQLTSLDQYRKEVLDLEQIQPKSLFETLKLFKITNVFLKGIQFPDSQEVWIKLEYPKYEEIKRIANGCRKSMWTKHQTIVPNLREVVNPLHGSLILPEDSQYDLMLQVLPNFSQSQLLYRLTEHKLMGQTFRNLVYDKGPTLLLIKANNRHIFGGYSPIPWTDELSNNWKRNEKSFLFTITDNKGREPMRLNIREGKEEQALYHSRTMIGFGSGFDLCINLIDLKKSESAMYSYFMPAGMGQDVDKFLAGKRDKWDIKELEVFRIDPIEGLRYQENRQSLIVMAKQAYAQKRDEQLMEEIVREEEQLLKEQQRILPQV